MNKLAKPNQVSKKTPRKTAGRLVARASAFSGPLPPPEILNGYEKVCPGAADRVIKMAESQSKHRQSLEKSVVKSNIENEKTGMWMSLILTISIMGAGVYLILNDKNTVGFFAFFAPAVFQAGNYIYNKYREKKIREKPKKK